MEFNEIFKELRQKTPRGQYVLPKAQQNALRNLLENLPAQNVEELVEVSLTLLASMAGIGIATLHSLMTSIYKVYMRAGRVEELRAAELFREVKISNWLDETHVLWQVRLAIGRKLAERYRLSK